MKPCPPNLTELQAGCPQVTQLLHQERTDMATVARSTFKMEGWDENPYAKIESGGKLTQASVKAAFSGNIEGEGAVEWLMCYRPDETAQFVGLQRIIGRIGDRSGSFVLINTAGTFDGKAAKGKLSVVPGSGAGDLSGLRGHGAFTAPVGGQPSIELHYDWD
jgi:hypothetical protein